MVWDQSIELYDEEKNKKKGYTRNLYWNTSEKGKKKLKPYDKKPRKVDIKISLKMEQSFSTGRKLLKIYQLIRKLIFLTKHY